MTAFCTAIMDWSGMVSRRIEGRMNVVATYHLHTAPSTNAQDDLETNPGCCAGRCGERGNQAVADGGNTCTKDGPREIVSHSRYCE